MAAFSPYAGEYEWAGKLFHWRCYSTSAVYSLRLKDHATIAVAPKGRRWVALEMRDPRDPPLRCLVDETVANFSQILIQINGDGGMQTVSAAGWLPPVDEPMDIAWAKNLRQIPLWRSASPDADSGEITAVA